MAGERSLGTMFDVDTCLYVYLFSLYSIAASKEAWFVDLWEVLGILDCSIL